MLDFRFFMSLIKVGLFIVAVLGLGPASKWALENALIAQKTGFISYKKIQDNLINRR